nr:hypothetical protein [Tanacetum cinerariifolium]
MLHMHHCPIGEQPLMKTELIPEESNNVEGMRERKCEGEVVDNMFNAYLNLKKLGRLNTFRAEYGEDLDSRSNNIKANGSDIIDNEATSSVIRSTKNMQRSRVCSVFDKREGTKRSVGGDIAPMTRHHRRVSIDSALGKMNFIEESLKLPPSLGGQMGKIVSGDSVDPNVDTFNLEFGYGMFNEAKLKKIMANENLVEMALTDPKSVKRKEDALYHETGKQGSNSLEATTLSARLTLLQICRYKEHRWDLEQLIGSGGMPPSHSVTVTALAVLNQIVIELPAQHPLAESKPLRELLGHTPPHVIFLDFYVFLRLSRGVNFDPYTNLMDLI